MINPAVRQRPRPRSLVVMYFSIPIFLLIAPTPVSADGEIRPFTVASETATLAEADDGKASFTVSVTNLTNAPLAFNVKSIKCTDSEVDKQVAAGSSSTLTITVDSTNDICAESLTKGGEQFELSAAGATTTITVNKEKDTDIDWLQLLLAYLIGIVAALIVLLVSFFVWREWPLVGNKSTETAYVTERKKIKLRDRLEHLAPTYSFKDSWASNVTLVVGILTAVLGSTEVLKAISQSTTKAAQAQAVAGSAISVALIAMAPVLIQMTRRRGEDKTAIAVKITGEGDSKVVETEISRTYSATVYGLILAGAVTLGAGSGLAFVVGDLASELDLDGIESFWVALWIVPTVFLIVYGITNLYATLVSGTVRPPKLTAETIKAATIIAEAIRSKEPVATDQSKPEPVATDQSKPEPVPTDQSKPEPVPTDQSKPDSYREFLDQLPPSYSGTSPGDEPAHPAAVF